MSKVELSLQEATLLANKVVRMLAPYCQQIEVAGSLRRQKSMVGDIELVCVPLFQADLFGNDGASMLTPYLELLARDDELLKGDKWGPKYKKLHPPELPELSIDLFVTTVEEWGYTFTIRTGSANFSHKLVTPRIHGGFLPGYLRVAECRLWENGKVLDTSTELKFLEALRVGWIEPRDR